LILLKALILLLFYKSSRLKIYNYGKKSLDNYNLKPVSLSKMIINYQKKCQICESSARKENVLPDSAAVAAWG